MSSTEVHLDLPADPSVIADARRFAQDFLSRWGASNLEDTVCLLVSEVVTNSVVHGGTSVRLTLRRDGDGLRVEVRDGSDSMPLMKRYSDTATTGRGLRILDALASAWGSVAEGSGKLVWFEVRSVFEGLGDADHGQVGETRIESPPGEVVASTPVRQTRSDYREDGRPVNRVLIRSGR